jgi:hypothetical protein
MFYLVIHLLNLFMLDRTRLFPLISETLENRIEPHLLIYNFHFSVHFYFGLLLSEGTFGSFYFLVCVKRSFPIFDFVLGKTKQHTIKLITLLVI